MELRQLSYFVSIAEAASFSKAATRISVAQPALSRQIRMLEEELAIQLFHRNGRGVTLTAAGKVYYDHATAIIAQVDKANSDVAQLGTEPAGPVVLGLTPTLSAILLARVVADISERYPKVKLRVREGFSATVADWLQAGSVDIAVVYGLQQLPGINADTLLSEDLFLIAAPDWRPPEGAVRGDDLARIPLVLPARPHGLRMQVELAMAKAGHRIEVRFEIDSMATMLELAARGLAATILPKTAVRKEVAAGLVSAHPIEEPAIQRTMLLATAAHQSVNSAMQIILDTLKTIARNL